MELVTEKGQPAIVLRALNAKSVLWKEVVQDAKGEYPADWITTVDMFMPNGGAPNVVRRRNKSTTVVALVPRVILRKIFD